MSSGTSSNYFLNEPPSVGLPPFDDLLLSSSSAAMPQQQTIIGSSSSLVEPPMMQQQHGRHLSSADLWSAWSVDETAAQHHMQQQPSMLMRASGHGIDDISPDPILGLLPDAADAFMDVDVHHPGVAFGGAHFLGGAFPNGGGDVSAAPQAAGWLDDVYWASSG